MQEIQDFKYEDHMNSWWVPVKDNTGKVISTDRFKLTKRNTCKVIKDYMTLIGLQQGIPLSTVESLIKCYRPQPSKTEATVLVHFSNSNDYHHKREVKIKPGKLLKKMFPTATSSQVDLFATFYHSQVVLAGESYTIHVGKEQEDFRIGFTNLEEAKGNLAKYTIWHKSSHDSCMRGSFSDLKYHPSEAYASGDFEIVTVRNSKGKVAARSVVCVQIEGEPCYKPAPMYASSQFALTMLEEYLRGKSPFFCKALLDTGEKPRRAWYGARMKPLFIDYGHSSYPNVVLPYCDYNYHCILGRVNDEGEFELVYANEEDHSYYTYGTTSGYRSLELGSVTVRDACNTERDKQLGVKKKVESPQPEQTVSHHLSEYGGVIDQLRMRRDIFPTQDRWEYYHSPSRDEYEGVAMRRYYPVVYVDTVEPTYVGDTDREVAQERQNLYQRYYQRAINGISRRYQRG